jgi:hypothetical protein
MTPDVPPPAPSAFVRIADLTDRTIDALRRVNGEQAAELDALRGRLADMADALANMGEVLDRERAAVRVAHDTVAHQAETIADLRRRLADMAIDLDGTKKERDRAERKGR